VTTDVLVWHRDDLRVRDNPALAAAARDGRPHPLFVFDPRFYRSDAVCDGRVEFVHEALAQLDAAYGERGGALAYRHGDPLVVLRDLLDEGPVDRVYLNATTTRGYARERDEEVAGWDAVEVVSDDGIVRSGPRGDGWADQAEAYFERERHDPPGEVGSLPSATDPAAIADEYGVDSGKDRHHRGGCRRARERLQSFVADVGDYVGGISPPAEAEERTSHLSPYLAVGCLSPRQAYQYAHDNAVDGRALELFTSRLFWNRHFTQKLADDPRLTERAVNPVFRGMNRDRHDPDLAAAWRRGETGFPLVDASMRALRETGWLNFRMRAMCASFYSYVLGCWWRVGADHFYRHLVDADPAINYAQWQMQSGLVGVHPLRIYDPRKQVRDNDPEGTYVRRYVPELAGFPAAHLDRPEKAPLAVQQECGVRVGEDYPAPVVDFERRRGAARDRWAALSDRARAALADPEIRRRASLSEGRDSSGAGVDDGERPAAGGQTSLDAFE
jgi:deoxyribodipyrimidine photo-lyase